MNDNLPADPLLHAFQQGEVFAYPTEAVFGLGCDPDNKEAVYRLLALKDRPVEKGLILIAKTYSQLLKYVDDSAIPLDKRTEIFSSWPGPVTWLLPKSTTCPEWITGGSDLVAVRVTDHEVVQDLCSRLCKPLVSTSCNVSGMEPARTSEQVLDQFADEVVLVGGKVGGQQNPSVIKHGITGQILRAS